MERQNRTRPLSPQMKLWIKRKCCRTTNLLNQNADSSHDFMGNKRSSSVSQGHRKLARPVAVHVVTARASQSLVSEADYTKRDKRSKTIQARSFQSNQKIAIENSIHIRSSSLESSPLHWLLNRAVYQWSPLIGRKSRLHLEEKLKWHERKKSLCPRIVTLTC